METTDELSAYDFGEKKKKRKPKATTEELKEKDENKDCDHTYVSLLDRLFSQLRKDNPHFDTPQPRVQVPFPQLSLVGSKRIMWLNFSKTCDILHRLVDHVQSFFLSELSTLGSLDVNGRLIIKGRWKQHHIELLLKKYIDEYVKCHTCKHIDTVLVKDPVSRFMFVECQGCQSKHTVAPIRAGFYSLNRVKE